jgi:plastocyanin
MITVALAAALTVAACSGSSEPSGAVARGDTTGPAVELLIDDGEFRPTRLEVPANKDVVIRVTNKDGTPHDFAVASQDLNTGVLKQNAVATATVKVGTDPITFVCTLHSGMKGTIAPIAKA